MSTMTPDMQALKTRLKATWSSGDYSHFAQYLEEGALEFLHRLPLQPGMRMLDVGCGAGQIALPAARMGVRVTGVDLAPNLVKKAQERAAAEGLRVEFEEGDAEALSYPDGGFDIVVSLIGAMFAPRPALVAAELLRVCRSGGTIAMANWTPEGHVGQMFKIVGSHVPPSPLMESPLKWGKEEVVRERLQGGAASIAVEKRSYPMRYPFGPAEVAEFFFTYYGPTLKALAALDADGQQALRRDLAELWTRNNVATDGTTLVLAEYLEVQALRQ
jgi:SAM-dependent methyltransferase